MSAQVSSNLMLSRIATALSQVLAQDSQKAVGELCGRDASTICRRGADLEQWSGADLIRLALHRGVLSDAIGDNLSARTVAGDRAMAIPVLLKEIEEFGTITNEIAKALADGIVSRREAADLRGKLQLMVEHLHYSVLPTLSAIEAG